MEYQLRPLKSQENSSILYPMIESCLSEELFQIWQISMHSDRPKDKLDDLLNIIRREVENKEGIILAKDGRKKTPMKKERVATATELLTIKLGIIFLVL